MCETLRTDFLVLGGGTAGCVFANRLSRGASTILVEAGFDPAQDPRILNPLDFVTVGTALSPIYMFREQDLPNAQANNRTFMYGLGRLLGGGSSINGLLWSKSARQTYDAWVAAAGPRWAFEPSYATLAQLEHYTPVDASTNPNPGSHGYAGPIAVRQAPATPTRMSDDLVEALVAGSGLPRIEDYNNPLTPLGVFSRWQLTQRNDHTREFSSRAFLGPEVLDPQTHRGVNGHDLRVLLRAVVTRLLWRGTKAVGAELLVENRRVRVYARHAVVGCLGTHLATLLQRSGVGPADVLARAGIKPRVINEQVGRQTVKHQIGITFRVPTDPATGLPIPGVPADDKQAIYSAGAYVPDPSVNEPTRRAFHIAAAVPNNYIPSVPANILQVFGVLLQPHGEGRIAIQSADPFNTPLIEDRVLGDARDLESIKAFLRRYVPALHASLTPKGYTLLAPSLAVVNDDVALTAFVRANVDINFHLWTNSCRMHNDPRLGVADGNGRVHGTSNLIIADTSTMPTASDGVPQAIAYLFAESLSRDLLASVRPRRRRHAY